MLLDTIRSSPSILPMDVVVDELPFFHRLIAFAFSQSRASCLLRIFVNILQKKGHPLGVLLDDACRQRRFQSKSAVKDLEIFQFLRSFFTNSQYSKSDFKIHRTP